MDWYYAEDRQTNGPYAADDLFDLLKAGAIDAHTLVWRTGMTEWTALGSVEELAVHLRAAPPPIPPSPPDTGQPPGDDTHAHPDAARQDHDATDAIGDREHVEPSAAKSDGASENTRTGDPFASATQGDQAPGAAGPSNRLAGPWLRHWARQFDIVAWVLILSFAIPMALEYVSPSTYIAYLQTEENLTGLLLFAGAFAVNGIVITLFGNSIGKTIIGLRAVPVEGEPSFGLLANLSREFRVWLGGLAAGLPFVALFTMIMAYREVRAGRPAFYDRNKAQVIALPVSKWRRALGITLTVILLLGALAIVVWAVKHEVPQEWKNPVTGQSVTLPGGWFPEVIKDEPEGARLYRFTATDASKVVDLGTVAAKFADFKLEEFGHLVEQRLAASVELQGKWLELRINGARLLRRDGRHKEKGWPVTYFILKDGNRFWTINVRTLDTADRNDPATSPIVEKLVATLS